MKYSSYIDHTLLKADAKQQKVKNLIVEAIKYDFFSVCINPCYVKLAKKYTRGTDVKVCTVIGFPLGANDTKTKLFEAKKAIKDGADEIDVVINIAKLKDKKYNYVEKELKAIRKASGKTLIKVILETTLLTKDEIVRGCEIAIDSGMDYVKTSTGFAGGATVEAVETMKEVCKDKIKIKASGGIRDFESMKALIVAGANRIGTSNGVAIMEEIIKNSSNDR